MPCLLLYGIFLLTGVLLEIYSVFGALQYFENAKCGFADSLMRMPDATLCSQLT